MPKTLWIWVKPSNPDSHVIVSERNPQVVLYPACAWTHVIGNKSHIWQLNQIYRMIISLRCAPLTFRLLQVPHMLEECKSFPWRWSLSSYHLFSLFLLSRSQGRELFIQGFKAFSTLHLSTHFPKHSIRVLVGKACRGFSDPCATFNPVDPWPLSYRAVLIFL